MASEIGRIRTNASHASEDAERHNEALPDQLVDSCANVGIGYRREETSREALGFPLARRKDAPRPVPLARKPIGAARQGPSHREPYRDEPALTSAQYEDALAVVYSTLRAMERTPSVASGLPEETLRDQILVQLNGTFEGGATGETFVQSGKTDILVVADDRHVFVGECKWWAGQKGCSEAVDQLLSTCRGGMRRPPFFCSSTERTHLLSSRKLRKRFALTPPSSALEHPLEIP